MRGGALRRLTSGLPWPVIWIGGVTFLVIMGVSLVPPALPRYSEQYSLSNAEVAMLLSSFSTGMLIFSFPGGMIADRLGFKRVALAGCAVAGVGALTAAALPPFWLLIGAQFSQGLGAGLYVTTGIAAIVAQTPDDRVGRATATYQGTVLSGMSIAPALGGMAVALLGLSGPFLVYAVAAFVGLAVTMVVLPSDRRDRSMEKDADAAGRPEGVPVRRVAIKQLLTTRAAVIALAASFVTYWAVGGIRNTLIPLFGEASLGMGPVGIGWLLTAASLSNIAVIRHAGRAIDTGRRRVTIWSLAGFAVSVAVAGLAGAPWFLLLATLMIGATKGYAGVVPVAVITDVAHLRFGDRLPADRDEPRCGDRAVHGRSAGGRSRVPYGVRGGRVPAGSDRAAGGADARDRRTGLEPTATYERSRRHPTSTKVP